MESPNHSSFLQRRSLKIVGSTLCLLLAVEIALQIRSHLKFGQSVLNVFTSETRYIKHPQSGLLTLRPNTEFSGKDSEVSVNAEGLRNASVTPERAINSLRLVFIGASTVMGAYAKNNSQTGSAILQSLLQIQLPKQQVEIVNAGIAGYTLAQQKLMLDFAEHKYSPDGYLIYTGNNDFAGYCKVNKKTTVPTLQLPQLTLPKWLLTPGLLLKNTVHLRPEATSGKRIDPESLDLSGFERSFRDLLLSAKNNEKQVLVLTNAKAYRSDQPIDLQMKLSETARFYNSCFDLKDLHRLYELHNKVISKVAAEFNYPVLVTEQFIPGGQEYFADATHFSYKGEQLIAKKISEVIHNSNMFGAKH